ncbi:MAG: hypothetical protein A2505_10975 [Deltaproteobacteria bacterium RIFOXYD12_FULL_55_16]|nr:MAG: hypothetical protein A2505_10975 [Deltaproteobacteria bacterium RIFOXYD12_FULL_55_16]
MSVSRQNNRPVEGKLLRLYLKKLAWKGASDSPGGVQAAPQIHLDFGHGNSLLAGYEDCHEVWLRLQVTATLAGRPMYSAEIVQAGIFRLVPARPGRIEVLFAWCSGVLYAQTLRALALTMRNGGFEPLAFHDRSFSRAFRIEVGGPAITLGRLSDLGEIMPEIAALRLKASRPVLRGDWPLFRLALYAVLGTCVGFYLLFFPGNILYRLSDSVLVAVDQAEWRWWAPEMKKPVALPPAPTAPVEAEEKVAGQAAESGLSLPEDSGQAVAPVTPLMAVPVQDHESARYAAALESGARWAEDQPPAYFTLQVGALGQLENLAQLIGHSRFDDPLRLLRSVTAENGKPLYLILLGSYPSESAAVAAARKLRGSDAALVFQVKSFAALAHSGREP